MTHLLSLPQFFDPLRNSSPRHPRRTSYSGDPAITDGPAFRSRYEAAQSLVQEWRQSTEPALDIGLLHQHQYKTKPPEVVLLIF
jgi:hypothetical protein